MCVGMHFAPNITNGVESVSWARREAGSAGSAGGLLRTDTSCPKRELVSFSECEGTLHAQTLINDSHDVLARARRDSHTNNFSDH